MNVPQQLGLALDETGCAKAANDPFYNTPLGKKLGRMMAYEATLDGHRRWLIVMERANYRCESCARKRTPDLRLEIDHRIPKSVCDGDPECIANLRVLCVDCHKFKTALDRLRYSPGFGKKWRHRVISDAPLLRISSG